MTKHNKQITNIDHQWNCKYTVAFVNCTVVILNGQIWFVVVFVDEIDSQGDADNPTWSRDQMVRNGYMD